MKLPRLGDPTVIKSERRDIWGYTESEEVIIASQWDLLPTWAQWVFMGAMLFCGFGAVAAIVLQKYGYL